MNRFLPDIHELFTLCEAKGMQYEVTILTEAMMGLSMLHIGGSELRVMSTFPPRPDAREPLFTIEEQTITGRISKWDKSRWSECKPAILKFIERGELDIEKQEEVDAQDMGEFPPMKSPVAVSHLFLQDPEHGYFLTMNGLGGMQTVTSKQDEAFIRQLNYQAQQEMMKASMSPQPKEHTVGPGTQTHTADVNGRVLCVGDLVGFVNNESVFEIVFAQNAFRMKFPDSHPSGKLSLLSCEENAWHGEIVYEYVWKASPWQRSET